MNETQKLSIGLGSVLGIVILVSLSFLINFSSIMINSDFETIEEISQKNEKIIMVGSSYLTGINPIKIENILKDENKDFSVFNLLLKGDTPFERKYSDLEHIKKLNPKLVLYGIGIRDLDCSNLEVDRNAPIFPPNSEIDAPKQFSIKFLKFFSNKIINQNMTNQGYYPTYIMPIDRVVDLEAQNFPINNEIRSCKITHNYQVNALIDNIEELKNNNSEVVIFLVPHSNIFWEKISTETKESFYNTMKEISQNSKISVYDLSYEFEDANIFSEPTHVANNPKVTLYTERIGKIILNELK